MKKRMIVLGSVAALSLSGAALGDFVFFTNPDEFWRPKMFMLPSCRASTAASSKSATVREQFNTGGLYPIGICEISASVGQYPPSRIPEHVRVALGATDTAPS